MRTSSQSTREVRASRRVSRRSRKGVGLVLTALLLIVIMMLLAFSIDLGYISQVQCELDRAVDSAALAGAGKLIEGMDVAEAEALDFFLRNRVGQQEVPESENRDTQVDAWDAGNPDAFDVEFGQWNMGSRTFMASSELPSTVRIYARYDNAPLFFARALGFRSFSVESEAVARFQPRDIELVLDFSASMNDDSELKRIDEYGEQVREDIEQNLLEIYQDLGSPTFGTMQWTPQYISSNYTSTVRATLGLDGVPYPYPAGSWNDYINYVKSGSNTPAKVGYQKRYGYLTLVNYWLERMPQNNQTPDLWMVRAQPVTAVKDAVSVFLDYITAVDTDDRVGLSIYNSPSQQALVEQTLTGDFQVPIENIVTARQAGHYDSYTNIGAGIRTAWQDLETNAREGATKMIVLMTDGIANRPNNTADGRQYALEQAQEAANRGYPVVTISLGNGADTALMEQIANMTEAVHFNVPGDSSVASFEDDLKEVFKQIADDRPLLLVK